VGVVGWVGGRVEGSRVEGSKRCLLPRDAVIHELFGHPRTLRRDACLPGMLHQMHAPRWGTLSGGVAVGGDDGRRRYWGRVEQGIQG